MSAYPPPIENVPIFDSNLFSGTTSGGGGGASGSYLTYPVSQGSETIAGSLSVTKNVVMTGTANVNYIEFPDGTKQYTAPIGTGGVSTSIYTADGTITPPTNTYAMDITIISNGGEAGAMYVNGGVIPNELSYGGSGAGGNMAICKGINWDATQTLTLDVSPSSFTVNFGTDGSLGTAIVYSGGDGQAGLIDQSGGGAGGLASTIPNSLPTGLGAWSSSYGANGQAGGAVSFYPYTLPTAVGGSIVGTTQTAGLRGGGQSYQAVAGSWEASPYMTGAVIITWYLTP